MAWKRVYGETYYKKNREKVLLRNRERYAANPDYDRNKHLKKKYGITIDQYRSMAEAQNNRCKICEGPPSGKGRFTGFFCVDHDHKTGKIRGLLCSFCNTGIGSLKENPEIFRKALAYLETV